MARVLGNEPPLDDLGVQRELELQEVVLRAAAVDDDDELFEAALGEAVVERAQRSDREGRSPDVAPLSVTRP